MKQRDAMVAVRECAEAFVQRWRAEESKSGVVAARTRGNTLIVAAHGQAAYRVERELLRAQLLDRVQIDDVAHVERTVKADWLPGEQK